MNQVTKDLISLTFTRDKFHTYYKDNISNEKTHFQAFIKLPFYAQLGVYLYFINANNLSVDIYRGGYSVFVIDSKNIPKIDIEAEMYFEIDGDVYVYDTVYVNYGKSKGTITKGIDITQESSYYWQRAIITALEHLNLFTI